MEVSFTLKFVLQDILLFKKYTLKPDKAGFYFVDYLVDFITDIMYLCT